MKIKVMKYFRQLIIQTVMIYGPKIMCATVCAPWNVLYTVSAHMRCWLKATSNQEMASPIPRGVVYMSVVTSDCPGQQNVVRLPFTHTHFSNSCLLYFFIYMVGSNAVNSHKLLHGTWRQLLEWHLLPHVFEKNSVAKKFSYSIHFYEIFNTNIYLAKLFNSNIFGFMSSHFGDVYQGIVFRFWCLFSAKHWKLETKFWVFLWHLPQLYCWSYAWYAL